MERSAEMNSKMRKIGALLLACLLLTAGCGGQKSPAAQQSAAYQNPESTKGSQIAEDFDLAVADIPAYSGSPYAVIGDNVPAFAEEELTAEAYEVYSDLDSLGRCGPAEACLGQELMPTGERGSIGQVKPSGWHTVKYDWVDGKYLFNRCHLIGYQLADENANEKNLITGTRYMNVEGMLPFENLTADYIRETNNHVMYRVTPVFEGNNLVAAGVRMEAWSVEDDGAGVCFDVYVYNSQPGVIIDYATGESREDPDGLQDSASGMAEDSGAEAEQQEYILNTSSGKFHLPACSGAKRMQKKNREVYQGSREDVIAMGYEPCKSCNP